MPREIEVKSILNKTKRRYSWFLDDYTLNLYSSCSFNCLYCYIRGSKYGTNLEQSLSIKTNSIQVLDKQLYSRAKRKQYGFIAVSSATDPYLQAEKKYEMMRAALKVIAKHQFPVHIITKSDLIERDFDLLHTIDENAILPDDLRTTLGRGVIVSFSFSTLDDKVAKIFEPGATPPSFRLKAIEKSLAEGLYTGISLMPLLPHISDTQESLEHMYSTFKALNVKYILSASLTLFGTGKADSKTLMMQAITKYFPELKETYNEYFKYRYQMSNHYKRILSQRLRELSVRFEIPDKIEGSHSKNLKYPLNA